MYTYTGEIKVNSKATSAVGVWKTDTRRLLAVRELATDVQQVTINPSDNYLLCLSGNTYLRYLKCAGSNMDEVCAHAR